jgi:Hypothetical glycosyl hydrolase family 15
MRGRYLAALAAAGAVALVLLWHSRTVTTKQPAARPPPVENRGVLRITPSQELPDNLAGVRYLLLDSSSASEVAGLKQRYARLKILAYKNLSFLIDYSRDKLGNAGVPWPYATARESWFLHDGNGRRVRSVHYKNAWFADVGNPSYESAWRGQVSAFLRGAPWDGVFLDDALADPGWHLGGAYGKLSRYPTREAYRAAERAMLLAVAPPLERRGYLVIANVVASPDQQDVWADWAGILSGVMLEHFVKTDNGPDSLLTGAAWKLDVDAERAVEARHKIFLALSYGPDDAAAAQGYTRASFLLFARPKTQSASIWSPDPAAASTMHLGRPLDEPHLDGSVWTRRFERGTLWVDPSAGTYGVRQKR